MKGHSRSPLKRSEALHKYLKPGALARIRDSKIGARSHKPDDSLSQLAITSLNSVQSGQTHISMFDHAPQFLSYSYGPRYLKRKKLSAARSVNLQGLEPSSTDSFINVPSGDAVAAH